MSSLVRLVLLLIALLPVAVADDVVGCSKSKLLAVLQPLKSNANYSTCQSQLKPSTRLCSVAACKPLIAPMTALSLPNCTDEETGFSYNPAALKWQSSAVCEETGDPIANWSHLFYGGVVKSLHTSLQ
jgi:hypothetical protein